MKITVMVIIFLLGSVLGTQYSNLQNRFNASSEHKHESQQASEKTPLYWVAPMDKNYRRDGPGLSPMGMELVPVYAEDNQTGNGEGDVRISAAVENNLGVKTAEVIRTPLYFPIDTVGTVQIDERKIKHIHSRVEGWIEVLNVASIGETVQQGQTLYELYSPALVNAQEEYLAALRSSNANLIKASKSRLLSLGLETHQVKRLEQRRKVDQRVKVLAESDGIVINLTARPGMFIKPATEVLAIASLESVWVIGEVFERQAYAVKIGQQVDINVNSMPGKQWQGEINYIYPELDPQTRTQKVRINIENSAQYLKPNMLANLRIISGRANSLLSIPNQAVIKARDHDRVVKSLGDGRYQSVVVRIGYEALDKTNGQPRIPILSGLAEGDFVVTSAQFLIDSESSVSAELERMASHSQPSAEKENTTVTAMGVLNSVMADHNMLNITHAPVDAWGWPEMTMNLDVAESVDLSHLKQNDHVHFTLEKNTDGSILITHIMLMSEHSDAHQEADK